MPIISNFPGGAGGAGGGLTLAAVTNIQTLKAHNKVYIKWTDPSDLVVAGSTLAAWGGTLLIRKAGSPPVSRRDGVQVLDSKKRDQYKDSYFCDSGVTDGQQYYYKFFPYTTSNSYTDDEKDMFEITPEAVNVGNVTNMKAVAAGNGKLNITWNDPEQTVVSDGITLATWESTTVVVKKGGYATSPDDEADFKQKSNVRNAHTSTPMTATNLENGTTYYISFFPTTTDGAVNKDAANRITGVPNRLVIANVPTQNGTLTYNGTSQQPSWTNYDQTKMQLSVIAQTNAGDYTATFTPLDDYCWSVTDNGPKQVPWKINRKAGTLTVNPNTITLDKTHLSQSFTIGGEHDGTVSIVKNDASNVFTATLGANNTVTVTSNGQATGSGTIVVKCTQGTNYTAPTDASVSVNAKFMPDMGLGLENYTWEQIDQISEAKMGDDYFDVSDTKSVLINGTVGTKAYNNSYYVYILEFNHDGDGRITFGGFKTAASGGIDICLTDSKYNSNDTSGAKYFNMNHKGNYNHGGWAACDLRYDVLGSTDRQPDNYNNAKAAGNKGYDASATTATNPVPGTLMAALPTDLRQYMKPMTVYTDNVGGGSNTAGNVTASVDYLPLLAEFEIFGTRSQANSAEQNSQKRYTYFANSNPTKKFRDSATSTAANWWERSPLYNDANYFCVVTTGGNAGNDYANYSYGLAPAFKI